MRIYKVFITDDDWRTKVLISKSRNAKTLLMKYGHIGCSCRVYYNMKQISAANWSSQCGIYRVKIS